MSSGNPGTAARRLVLWMAATLAALVTSGALAAHAQAAGWLAPVDVSAKVSGGQMDCGLYSLSAQPGVAGVDVAVAPSGETVVVWTRANGANQLVQAAIRPPGGSFGSPQTLGTTSPCYFFGLLGSQPKVAVSPRGEAVVVWGHPLTSSLAIQAAVRPPGASFGPAITLSDASRTAQNDPDVAISDNGTIVAVWTWNNGTRNVIQAATRPPGGSFPVPGAAQTLSDTAQAAGNARVASNARGDVAVVWQRSNGSNQIAQARVRPAGGSFAPTVDLSDKDADASAPAVAIDPRGRATAVWTRSNLVESRFLTAAGALDGGIDNVSDVEETVSAPSVALDAANNAVAVWSGGPSSLTKGAARASRASFGTPQTISGPGSSNSFPVVAMDPAGNAVAVWSQGTRIQAATRPAGGSFGGVEDVSRGTGNAWIPSLAIDGQGNAVAGWRFIQSGGPDVAQVTAFDAAPPAITSVTVPNAVTTGAASAMSAAAVDRWSGANISWNFGDGGTAAGPSVAHTYGAAGVYTVTVTATDGAGNATSTQRVVQVVDPPPVVSAPPVPTPAINVTLAFKYRATARSTRLTSLTVKGVPRGATVTATCRPPKRKGKTPRCPVRAFRKANAKKNTSLKPFTRKSFAKGTVIEVRVTKEGMVGAVKQLKIRGRGGPSTSTRCLPPGAKTPTRC